MNAKKVLLNFVLISSILNWQEASSHTIEHQLTVENGVRVSVQNPTTITRRGSIVNKTKLRILNGTTITNKGEIRNYNEIIGDGTPGIIINEGAIYNYSSYVPIYTCSQNGARYDFNSTGNFLEPAPPTIMKESYDLTSSTTYTKAAYYDLAIDSQIREFRKLFGATIDNVTIIGRDKEDIIENANFLSNDEAWPATRIAYDVRGKEITLNAENRVGENKSDKYCYASFYSLDGYQDATGRVEASDSSSKIIKTGSETLVLYSDCSWHNGLVEILDGKLDVMEEAAMFGGTIKIIGANSSVTWRGGAKDPYNKPHIILQNGSHLNFNLTDGIEDKFSVYGPIEGESDSTIVFKKGTIYIKSDCSGFKGHLQVDPGAKFVIRTDTGLNGQHKGIMFQGSFEVTELNGEATIDTSEGLEPLTVTKGTVRIVNDETGNVTINEITVGENAKAIIDLGAGNQDAILKNATIHGELELATGDETIFENLNIDGGLLRVTGANLGQLTMNGTFHVGSGINMMGNDIIDTIDATNTNRIQVYPGRDFDLYIDLDPASGQADNIIAPDCFFTGGSSLNIKDYRVINRPVDESYTFRVLTLTNPNATYLPIKIGTDKEVEGALGAYRLYAEGGDGFVTLRIPNATIAKNNEATKNLQTTQLNALNNAYLPLKLMHSAMFLNVSDIYNSVCSELDPNQALKEKTEDGKGKYRFWDKTFVGTADFKTTGNLIRTNNHGTIFGYDARPSQLANGAFFMPTVFGAYSAANIKHALKKGRANNYLAGTKLSWFSSVGSIEMLGSYGFFKTYNHSETYGKNNLKSHLFSVGSKFSYNIKLGKHVSLVPNILADYSFIKTKDSKIENVTIKNKNLHNINISPGINFLIEHGEWSATLGARVNGRLSGDMKGSLDGNSIISNTQKKSSFAYEMNFYRRKKDGSKMGLGLMKTTGGAKGIKIKLSLSAKF